MSRYELYNSQSRSGENPVRRLLDLTQSSELRGQEIITLAGGLPESSLFPLTRIEQLRTDILTRDPNKANYGPSAGMEEYLQAITEFSPHTASYHPTTSEVMAVTGSQQLLYLTAKMLCDEPGSIIGINAPAYLGALHAFDAVKPMYLQLPSDQEGVLPDALESAIRKFGSKFKFFYEVTNFNNPTGVTTSLSRREAIADIAIAHGIPVLEDDPYGLLRYRGEHLPSIKSLAPQNVIYASTFSKLLIPSMRTAYGILPTEFRGRNLRSEFVREKERIDLFSDNVDQLVVARYFLGEDTPWQEHVEEMKGVYGQRLNAMLEGIDEFFPEEFPHTNPEGGFFVWSQGSQELLKRGFDIRVPFERVIGKGAAFIHGRACYPLEDEGNASMRLAFSNQEPKKIYQALEIIGTELKSYMDELALTM